MIRLLIVLAVVILMAFYMNYNSPRGGGQATSPEQQYEQATGEAQALEQQMQQYQARIQRLKAVELRADAQSDLNEASRLAQRIQASFDRAHDQDQKILLDRIGQVLDRREAKLNGYLTEALLGLQRNQATLRKES